MFTIIGGDGKEYGPVSTEQVRAWLSAGRANLSTRARIVGTEEWRTLGDFAEFGSPQAAPPVTAYVTPATPPMSRPDVDAKAFAADLIARAPSLDVIGCLSRSFSLWTSNFFPLVGVTLLVWLAQVVINFIPFANFLSAFCLKGVFAGGLYYYYLGKIRGQHREVGDAFAGFSRALVPLMLATLLSTVIIMALAIIFCAPLCLFVFHVAMQGATYFQQGNALPAFGGLTVLGLLVYLLVLLYLGISWAFTYALIVDQGLGPWTAMEVSRRVIGKQWFMVFFVILLGGIMTMLGLVGLLIGIFFTLPLAIGATLYAYEDLCNPPPRV